MTPIRKNALLEGKKRQRGKKEITPHTEAAILVKETLSFTALGERGEAPKIEWPAFEKGNSGKFRKRGATKGPLTRGGGRKSPRIVS